MAGNDEEKVYADGYLQIPAKKWYQIADALTRQDELSEAILKVLGAINEKMAAVLVPAPPPPAVPPPLPPPPAPVEWTPVTDRLDAITNELKRIEFDEYFAGLPVVKLNRYTGTSTSYVTLVEWVVGTVWSPYTGYDHGELREISLACATGVMYNHAQFRITVERRGVPAVRLFEDRMILLSLTIPFLRNTLEPADRITVEVRSDDGTSITVDGTIAGREY